MKWRVILDSKKSPAENMAIDEAILTGNIRGFSPPTIRFYDWDPPTVSCGYNQIIEDEVDTKMVKYYSFDITRRPTGGRAVLHYDEVTYSVSAPVTGRFSGNLMTIYAEISMALKRGLNLFGIEADFERGTLERSEHRRKHNPCFNSTSKYELSVDKKKIVGSAQLRKEKAFLQHGSILRNNDQSMMAYLIPELDESDRKRLSEILKRKTISPAQLFQKKIEFKEMADSLILGFINEWSDDFFYFCDSLEKEELDLVHRLKREKYLTDKWIFKK